MRWPKAYMEESANNLAKKAEETRKLTLLAQSNILRDGVQKKTEKLATVDRRIKEILSKI